MAMFNYRKLFDIFIGISAIVAMLYILNFISNNIAIAFASLFLIFICITDSFKSIIPNYSIVVFLSVSIIFNLHQSGINGLLSSLSGLLIGLALLIIPFMLGGMGAGDVKALAVLGSLVGPSDIFQIFLYMGLIGGVIALFHHVLSPSFFNDFKNFIVSIRLAFITKDPKYLRPEKSAPKLKFPYAVSLAFGFCAFVIKGKII